MTRTKKVLAALLLTLTLPVMTTGCAKTPPNLTPQQAELLKAQRVISALNVLRDAAISANAQTPKLLNDVDTRLVVNAHEAAVTVIVQIPNGWEPAVLAALDSLQKVIPANEYNQIAVYVAAARAIIQVVVTPPSGSLDAVVTP